MIYCKHEGKKWVKIMNFGDKLSKFRKAKGLSQEGLAEKLEVTRQTVSKWELGQTRPDTDMLVKIADILDVDVSSLIVNEEESVKKDMNQKFVSDETKPRTWLFIILIILALVITVVLINKVVVDKKTKTNDNSGGIFDIFKGFMPDVNVDKKSFNLYYETQTGTQWGSSVNIILDKVITNNKTNDRKITVVYNTVSTEDPTEIKNLKSNFEDFTDYEVSVDYDDNGYVNKITVEDSNSKSNIDRFNRSFEPYSGEKMGTIVKNVLTNVATNNEKESRKITVVYNGTTVSEPEDIRNLKSNLDDWTIYEIVFAYDEIGYINQVTIR